MEPINHLSRRDFLKLSAAGALGLALSELRLERAFAAAPKQGRVTWSGVEVFDAPSRDAKQVHVLGKDEVVHIKDEVDGDEGYGNPHNKTWYHVENGFAYSGLIQPVETKYQKTIFNIHPGGQLAEITVPVSETRREPYVYGKKWMALYYGSTYWVTAVVVTREEKSQWYQIYDSHLHESFFVPAYNMRLIPDDELTLLSPNVPDAEKLIHVDLAAQLVTLFEGDTMIMSVRCSSGAGGTKTPLGDFSTYHKWPSVHMTNEGDVGNGKNIYDLPGVPWVCFFTGNGTAFHGTYWHNDYGRPRSHGCVNLPSDAAKFIYRWSRPLVPLGTDYVHLPGEGTRVQIVSSNV